MKLLPPIDSTIGKSFNFIDIMKFLMAFCVVCIHIGTLYQYSYSKVVLFTIHSAVPFFFVTSGFFLWEKFRASNFASSILIDYTKKVLIMYTFWIVVYLPLSIGIIIHGPDQLVLLKRAILVGEIPFSWPLWYLHALVVSVFIIWCFVKWRAHLSVIWLIGLGLMALGFAINKADVNLLSPPLQAAIEWYNDVFMTTRNGIFLGLGYVTTGMIISKYQIYIKSKVYNMLLGVVLFAAAIMCFIIDVNYWTLLSGTAIFIVCKNISLPQAPIYRTFRSLSTIIYLSHMLILAVLIKLLPKDDGFVLFATIGYIMSLAAAIAIYYISKHERMKWFRRFING